MLLIAVINAKSANITKLLCEHFTAELAEAFRFAEGLKAPESHDSGAFEGKIVWNRISSEVCFSYDCEGLFILDSMFMINCSDPRKIQYLLATLNSRVSSFWIRHAAATLGKKGVYAAGTCIEKLPIPRISPQNKLITDRITALSAQVIALKGDKALEDEIDSLVFELYGLGEDEMAMVENGKE